MPSPLTINNYLSNCEDSNWNSTCLLWNETARGARFISQVQSVEQNETEIDCSRLRLKCFVMKC